MSAEKKRFICDSCLTMTKEELVEVLNFLHREHVTEKLFSQNKDGIKINLNKVDDHVIDRLYNFVDYKISHNQTIN
jgi:hypothetical protein